MQLKTQCATNRRNNYQFCRNSVRLDLNFPSVKITVGSQRAGEDAHVITNPSRQVSLRSTRYFEPFAGTISARCLVEQETTSAFARRPDARRLRGTQMPKSTRAVRN